MLLLWGLVFVVSLFLLIKGADWMLNSSEKIGLSLGLSPFIVGVIIVGVGTSFPEVVSSLAAVFRGATEIVTANAVGSNIFDILVGLGLPFLLMILLSGNSISLEVKGIENSVIFLLASVVALFGLFIINKWEAGKKMGGFLILLYLGYVVWAILNVG